MAFLEHFVCFPCRKVFRKRLPVSVKMENYYTRLEQPWSRCPDCGTYMQLTSWRFKTPPRDDLKGWARACQCQRQWRLSYLRHRQERETYEAARAETLTHPNLGRKRPSELRKEAARERRRMKALVYRQDRILAHYLNAKREQ